MHDRYAVDHDFLSAAVGQEVVTISQTVNAFFRWEFNSCEMLVKATRCCRSTTPTPARTSRSRRCTTTSRGRWRRLVKWTAFCAATGRRAKLQVDTEPWFAVADDPDLSYEAKLGALPASWQTQHFETERYQEFCATALPDIDDMVLEWVSSADFDRMLTRDGHPDLSRARARAVPGPLPRPGRPVGQ